MERETLGSRLGFILLSAGCAIGLGNVWRFPWLAGSHGGGWFVLVYLVCLALLGVPVMTFPLNGNDPYRIDRIRIDRTYCRVLDDDFFKEMRTLLIYQALGHSGWRWHGWLSLAGCVLLMMYYTTVAGWMLAYFGFAAGGAFDGLEVAGIAAKFDAFVASPGLQVGTMGLVVADGFGVCALGLRRGLERVTKWMMLALLLLMGALAVHSVLLPDTAPAPDGTTVGSLDGIRYLLVPNSANVADCGGWGTLVREAMNQAFFTLSLGVGSMAIFGSYIGRERSLPGEAVRVAALDTLVALCAGLIVLPACFAFGVDPGQGPALLFVTLPNVFGKMAWGRLWGGLVFVFMSFAALSTVLAVFENILACVRELAGWSRRRAAVVCGLALFVLSLPCALGWSWLSGLSLPGGRGVLEAEDYVVSNLLLPLGALVYTVFCCHRVGWGWRAFAAEANAGDGFRFPSWLRHYCAWVLPLAILSVFLFGL